MILPNIVNIRKSTLLHYLYVPGRHNTISTIKATRNPGGNHPIVRFNASELKNQRLIINTLKAFIDEVSIVVKKKTLS